jgi:hypothetical protein
VFGRRPKIVKFVGVYLPVEEFTPFYGVPKG